MFQNIHKAPRVPMVVGALGVLGILATLVVFFPVPMLIGLGAGAVFGLPNLLFLFR